MFWVYVLESGGGKRYIGHTGDLDRRLVEHNSGLCKTTKADRDWQIVYTEQFSTRGEAIKREKWMKTGVGREFIKKVTRG
ncbi:GIY-YIG nuclease family protein [Candidatus Zixiibacteriota bacterium]